MQHKIIKNKMHIPSSNKDNFICPFCGAYSIQHRTHQTLLELTAKDYYYSFVFRKCNACERVSIFRLKNKKDTLPNPPETCFEEEELVYPKILNVVEPNPDMPEDVKNFFNEARSVSDNSTRAATALLRIATEKLVKDLLALKGTEYANTKMHDAIERLYKEKNLNLSIYKALMSLKLFGNEASHPNEDLSRFEEYFSNDKDLMNELFKLLNLIVDDLISKPKQIEELFNSAPRKNTAQTNKFFK